MNDEKLYLEIINNLHEGVYVVDLKRRITFWNKAAEQISGYKKEEMIGQFCHANLLDHIDKDGTSLCTLGCPLYFAMIDGRQRSDEVLLKHKEGHRVPIAVNIVPVIEDDHIVGAIEIFSLHSPTIYEDKIIEELSNSAMNDRLTGLANRRKIETYIKYRFNEMVRIQSKFCVVFLDVDDFSKFNNIYGHDVGDEVLKTVSKSIMRTVRKTDMFGRWGGEEFIGVFEIEHDHEAVSIAEKMREVISKSTIQYEDEFLSVTASLGVTVALDNDTIDSVVKRADSLMYQSKQKGKNCVTSDIGHFAQI